MRATSWCRRRLHPGKFYALPQAPQQYKQLYMISGFDRYFQIAPCFRDEDARADRSPGEFYQLDIEMSFVTQEDVFAAVEPVHARRVRGVRGSWAGDAARRSRASRSARRMLRYGTDKPDLRNPIEHRRRHRGLPRLGLQGLRRRHREGRGGPRDPGAGAVGRPRSFFDQMVAFAQSLGAPGLGWITLGEGEAKGPVAKFLGRASAWSSCKADGRARATATPCSSSATSRTRRPSSPGRCAPASARSWA